MSIITVSRMFGSGGSEVAARIAQSLGWQLIDNQFIDAVAERLGIPAAEVAEREERVPPLARRVADALSLATPAMGTPVLRDGLPPDEARLVESATRVIREAGQRGHTVLVGRGAQIVLAERSDVLHVFCYAPPTALVARASRRLGIPERDAAKLVDDTNKSREQYVRRHWRRSWLAHDNYHLCLNTEWLGLDGAVEIVVRLAREKFALGG